MTGCLLPSALVLLGIIVVALFFVGRSKNQKFKETGHYVVSWLPWLQIVVSYAYAFYVRIGFGRWPKSCIDNPDLSLIGLGFPIFMGVILSLWFLPMLWIGWLIIRVFQRLRSNLVWSIILFVTGYVAILVLVKVDPWGFWDWLFD